LHLGISKIDDRWCRLRGLRGRQGAGTIYYLLRGEKAMSAELSYTAIDDQRIASVVVPSAVAEGKSRKEFLPRRSGESRFAPPQYFYSASKSAALPIAADTDTAHADSMKPAA
jgi:hypothetical protein